MNILVYPQKQPKGFTLLELLVALAIFAFVSLIAYAGMNQVLQGRQQTDLMAQRLSNLQLALHYLERDLNQTIGRSIRDEYGDPQPAISIGLPGGPLLELSRHGWRNPAQHDRSHLQRVRYQLQEGTLMRTSWFYLDRAQDSPPNEQPLLRDITQIQIRVLDPQQAWQNQWPPQDTSMTLGSTPSIARPLAVEIVVELADWGRVRRVLRVGT